MDSLVITRESIAEVMDWIAANLARENLKEKEIYVTQMLVEELFLRFSRRADNPDNFRARLFLKKRFSHVRLLFVVEGDECNPLVPWSEDEEEDILGYALLRSHLKQLRYTRRWSERENVVSIQPCDPIGKEVRNILLGLLAGALGGLLMNAFVSPETNQWIDSNLIDSVQSVFVSALMMAVAPMIFFLGHSGNHQYVGFGQLRTDWLAPGYVVAGQAGFLCGSRAFGWLLRRRNDGDAFYHHGWRSGPASGWNQHSCPAYRYCAWRFYLAFCWQ